MVSGRSPASGRDGTSMSDLQARRSRTIGGSPGLDLGDREGVPEPSADARSRTRIGRVDQAQGLVRA